LRFVAFVVTTTRCENGPNACFERDAGWGRARGFERDDAIRSFVRSFVRAKRDPTAEGDGSLERMMSARVRLGRCGSVSMDRKAETRIDDDG